jgi:hypothetical protein
LKVSNPAVGRQPQKFGGAYGNRTRLCAVDSREPRQSDYAPWSAPGDSNADLELRKLVSWSVGRGAEKWHRGHDSNVEPAASETAALPVELTRCGWEWRNRTSEAGSKDRRLATNRTPKKWGDRRESNPRGLLHRQPPEPLGNGHIWCWRRRSHPRMPGFNRPLHCLSYSSEIGGRPGN